MKILIAPGAFKHSLSARDAAEAIARGLQRSGLDAELHLLPIADGGNGTLDAFLAGGGEKLWVDVCDPLGRLIHAPFAMVNDGRTAVIEMALASGIELLRDDERDPLRATTYGTGQLLQAALEQGARRFIIGMGGSATVDGGAGCLQALGIQLLDAQGSEIGRGGAALSHIAAIDLSRLDSRWRECEVIVASDVDNPALGETGAAAVFGPQKGATPQQIPVLEANLQHVFTLLAADTGHDVRHIPGGGAAGALAAGLLAVLGGRIESGIDLVLEHNQFQNHLKNASLVITGEGRMDEQTVHGKGPIGVARLAATYNVPTIALVGGLAVDDQLLHDAGIQAVLPIVTMPMPLEQAVAQSATLLEQAALRLAYLLDWQQTGRV